MTETESLCTSCRQEERLRHLMVLLACNIISSISACHHLILTFSRLPYSTVYFAYGESRDDIRARVRKYENIFIFCLRGRIIYHTTRMCIIQAAQCTVAG